jgi:hypothetical protein
LIRRAKVVIGVQLVLGTAVVTLAAIGYAGESDPMLLLAVALVAAVGLSQAVPALISVLLFRRGRVSAALLVSGAAAFVLGVMIVVLTVTSDPDRRAILVVAFGVALAGLGFHQLAVRSRLD